MKTTYAYGRTSLPAPVLSTGSGLIQGNNTTYYFWLLARNRVGFNQPSQVTSLVIPNNASIIVHSTNFITYEYENYFYIYLFISDQNDYSTSRSLCRFDLYASDQITSNNPVNITLNHPGILDTNYTVDDVEDLLTLPNIDGFRAGVNSLSNVYEYYSYTDIPNNNLTRLPGANNGQWRLIQGNTYNEPYATAYKEIYQVTDEEFIKAPLETVSDYPVSLKYYIINDGISPVNNGEINLNSYTSDASIKLRFNVKILGYLNLTTFVLDTTGVNYAGVIVLYPDTKLSLTKPLPVGSAIVIQVTPNFILEYSIGKGNFVSLYPKLQKFTTVSKVFNWSDPVADLATLKALAPSTVKNNQVRYVYSKNTDYVFDADNEEPDNGDTIIIPTGNPAKGRWKVKSIVLADGSVTENKLHSDVLNKLNAKLNVEYLNITISQAITLPLDNDKDYYIIDLPSGNSGTTVIDMTATLQNNEIKLCLVELRYKDSLVQFHNDIKFSNGNVPVMGANGTKDVFLLSILKDNNGILYKRGSLVQKNII